jgi:hypothetical protein
MFPAMAKKVIVPKHPLAEVFGFPTSNFTQTGNRYRANRLCPFHNKVASCTKDKANDPLGVCSVYDTDGSLAITCPIRFREDWIIVEDAARYFFPTGTKWTSIGEVRLNDKTGKSAGNIDEVLVSFNDDGKITDFGAIEVQAVYISGNIRRPFEYYMKNPTERHNFDWTEEENQPHADYLSSSRKRLVPQLIYKGSILKKWNKKYAVVVHSGFYNSLPRLPALNKEDSDIVWLIYDLKYNKKDNKFNLVSVKEKYTAFKPVLNKITRAHGGAIDNFIESLQNKLDQKLAESENGNLTISGE